MRRLESMAMSACDENVILFLCLHVLVLLVVNHYLSFSYFSSVWHPFSEVSENLHNISIMYIDFLIQSTVAKVAHQMQDPNFNYTVYSLYRSHINRLLIGVGNIATMFG
jgi:hypothetical protein